MIFLNNVVIIDVVKDQRVGMKEGKSRGLREAVWGHLANLKWSSQHCPAGSQSFRLEVRHQQSDSGLTFYQ